MNEMFGPGGYLSWSLLALLAILHTLVTLIISALREFSSTRLEEKLGDNEQIELFNSLLQDDHETVADLSTVHCLTFLALGTLVAWIQLSPTIVSPVGDELGHYVVTFPGAVDYLGFVSLIGFLALATYVWPRALGDKFAESVVIRIVPLVWRGLWLCQPITRPFRFATTMALRVSGYQEEDAVEEADDEILSAALEAVREGVLERSALDMIERIIDFRDIEVTEAMTPRVDIVGVSIDDSFDQVVELLIEHGHSRLPVYEGSIDKIVGIVHIKDCMQAIHELEGDSKPELRDVLRKPLFVPESKRLRDLFGDIKLNKIHIAIVVDEYGGTAGLVTVSDIVSEVFGDVDDEHDQPERKAIEKVATNVFSVDGKSHIDELNEELNVTLPESEDYDTIGGFLAVQLGKIPEVGDSHALEGLRIRVLEGDERKVDRVEIALLVTQDS